MSEEPQPRETSSADLARRFTIQYVGALLALAAMMTTMFASALVFTKEDKRSPAAINVAGGVGRA